MTAEPHKMPSLYDMNKERCSSLDPLRNQGLDAFFEEVEKLQGKCFMFVEPILSFMLSSHLYTTDYEDRLLKPNGWDYSRLICALFLRAKKEEIEIWANTPYVEHGMGLLLEPNKATIEAIEEARTGDIETTSIEDLFKDGE